VGQGVVRIPEQVGRPDAAEFPSLLPEECGAELFPGDGVRGAGVAIEVGEDAGGGVGGIGIGDEGDVDAEPVIAPVDSGGALMLGGEGLAERNGEGRGGAGGLNHDTPRVRVPGPRPGTGRRWGSRADAGW